jgi:hypothetical protein
MRKYIYILTISAQSLPERKTTSIENLKKKQQQTNTTMRYA